MQRDRPPPRPSEATLGPLLVAAKDDVDRTLFIDTLAMTPAERLESAYRFMRAIDDFRRENGEHDEPDER